MAREIPNFVSIDDLLGTDTDTTHSNKSEKANKSASASKHKKTGKANEPSVNNSNTMGKKIKLLFALLIIYLVVNTEAFIHHILRRFPGAVRSNETVASSTGVLVQGVIVVALYAMIDTIIANEWLI